MFPRRTLPFGAALFTVATFLSAFAAAWLMGSGDASRSAQRLACVLAPSVRAGDEMAVIDLVGSLRGARDLLALSVSDPGRTWASFGDVPDTEDGAGTSYRFPFGWISHGTLEGPGTPVRWVLVESRPPGPSVAGLLAVLAAVAGSIGLGSRTERAPAEGRASAPLSGARETDPVAETLGDLLDRQAPPVYLLLDARLRILGPAASIRRLASTPEGGPLFSHLLDLDPSPALVAALEKGSEVLVDVPFRTGEVRTAAIRKTPFGFLLELRP